MSIRYPVMVFTLRLSDDGEHDGNFVASVARCDRELADPALPGFLVKSVSAILAPRLAKFAFEISARLLVPFRDEASWNPCVLTRRRKTVLDEQFYFSPKKVEHAVLQVGVVNNDEEYLEWLKWTNVRLTDSRV